MPKTYVGFNFRKAKFDFVTLYEALTNSDWTFLNSYNESNVVLQAFYNKLNNIFENNIPKKKVTCKSYPPWFNGHIICRITQKHNALTKWKKTSNPEHLNYFKVLKYQIKSDVNNSHAAYIANQLKVT